MGTRRGSRRRRRRPPADSEGPAGDQAEPLAPSASGTVGGYGKAALVLALLIGMLIEQIASDVIPGEALDIFHLAVLIGIAFFVARWYRSYMRQALKRRQTRRRR